MFSSSSHSYSSCRCKTLTFRAFPSLFFPVSFLVGFRLGSILPLRLFSRLLFSLDFFFFFVTSTLLALYWRMKGCNGSCSRFLSLLNFFDLCTPCRITLSLFRFVRASLRADFFFPEGRFNLMLYGIYIYTGRKKNKRGSCVGDSDFSAS